MWFRQQGVYERFDSINTLAGLVNRGKQVWLTTAPPDGKTRSAICVARDSGKVLKEFFVPAREPPFRRLPPSST